MQKRSQILVEDVIRSNREAIKAKEPKLQIERNPNILLVSRAQDEVQINRLLLKLRLQYEELFQYVKNLKKYIGDINEETFICGNYLLLCNIFNFWNSFFILAENGQSSAAGNLIRTIKEGCMQVQLFSIDFLSDNRTHLDTWFKGGIITHGAGRNGVSGFIEAKKPSNSEDDLKDLSAHVYQIESQVSHNAYSSILELISPFFEDYDFDGYCGYYRTIAYIKYAFGSMESTNIALKMVYSHVLNDPVASGELDEILVRYKQRFASLWM